MFMWMRIFAQRLCPPSDYFAAPKNIAVEPHCGWPSEWEVLPCIDNEYALERLQWGDKAEAFIQIPAQLAASFSALLLTPYITARQADSTSPSTHASQKTSVVQSANPGLTCLWFDKTSDKENSVELHEELNHFTVQPQVPVRGGIQACIIVLLTYCDDVRGGCHTGTSPLSESLRHLSDLESPNRNSNHCWLPFTVENAPEWNITKLTKRWNGHLVAFASTQTHLHPWSIMAISCVDNILSLIVWKCEGRRGMKMLNVLSIAELFCVF